MPDKPAKPPKGDPPQGKPAPTRRAGRPRIDAVIRHIKAGSYDDDMGMLQGAIADRQQKLQEAVIALVKKTFGDDYAVVPPSPGNPTLARPGSTPQGERQNPFVKQAEEAALKREAELRAEAGDALGDDDPDNPDIESRSPVIGSVES